MEQSELKVARNKVASMLVELAEIIKTSDDRTDILNRLDHLHRDASNILLADRLMTTEGTLATINQWAKDVSRNCPIS